MGFEAMLAGYEAWKKTPQGKEYLKKGKTYKPIEIKPLPKGWELTDGSVKDGYFVYSDENYEVEITVEEHWGLPCWSGGYPKLHYVEVLYKEEDDSDAKQIARFSIYELGWDEAFRKANERAKEEMESLIK